MLDWILSRSPFDRPATLLAERAAQGLVRACLTATTLTDIFYIARKSVGLDESRRIILDLIRNFEILPVDLDLIRRVLASPILDLEDAIQDVAAERENIPIIVTRDLKGFAHSSRRILDAQSMLAELAGE